MKKIKNARLEETSGVSPVSAGRKKSEMRNCQKGKLKRKSGRWFFILFILILHFTFYILYSAYANFEDNRAGARWIGMNNAGTALSDDVYSLCYNPAGLAGIYWKELGLDYAKLHWGLDDGSGLSNGFIGYVNGFKDWGTFGFSWSNFSLSSYYSEDTLTLGYGRQVIYSESDLPTFLRTGFAGRIFSKLGDGSLNAGCSLKLLLKSYGHTPYTENAINLNTGNPRFGSDPVFENGYSRRGLSIDAGFMYNINKHHSLGLTVNNINQPDMGLYNQDIVYSQTKIGYAYRGSDFNMASDIAFKHDDYVICAGAEKWFTGNNIAVRGGLGIGSHEYSNLSMGASWKNNGLFQIDYSFNYPLRGISDTYGSHQVSLTMKFGAPGVKEEDLEAEIQKLKQTLDETRNEIELAKGQLKEKDNLEQKMQEIKEKSAATEEIKKRETRLNWELGMRYYRDNKYEDALAKFEQVLKLDPAHEQSKKMVEKCNEGIKGSKTKQLKKLWYAGTHYYKSGEYEKAIVEFRKILEIDPDHEQSQRLIKEAMDKVQVKKQAIDKQAVERYYTEGLKAYQRGDLNKAVMQWKKALEIDPANEEINKLLERTEKEIQLKEGGQ